MTRWILLVLLFASPARADTGALFGESARAASLADAVVARPGDTSAIFFNPAGIADLERPTLTLFGHAGNRYVFFARDGELGFDRERIVSGYGVSIAAALPGPEWQRRVHLGASLHIPGRNIIRTIAPTRADEPTEAYYGGRVDRTGTTIALALDLQWGLRIGGGVSVFPNLVAPTTVGFDASRGATTDEGVIIAQDRQLTIEASGLLGVRWQMTPELAVGLVWRQGGATRASGSFEIAAGSIFVSDEYRFYDLLAPEEVALGFAIQPLSMLSFSLDGTWARWSQFRTIHDEPAEPGFGDTIDVRFGTEWIAHRALRARLGYAFLPSPVPAQSGRHNFLDAHRHEIACGVGVDFEPLLNVPMRIDVSFRFHAQHLQRARKDPESLPDASPDAGFTIDNRGYPAFRSRGNFEQVSLSLTFALDGPPAPRRRPRPPRPTIRSEWQLELPRSDPYEDEPTAEPAEPEPATETPATETPP